MSIRARLQACEVLLFMQQHAGISASIADYMDDVFEALLFFASDYVESTHLSKHIFIQSTSEAFVIVGNFC